MNCWWHQWQISRAADDGRAPGAGTQRHLKRCSNCRAFAAQVQAMAELLTDDAPPLHRITPQSHRSLHIRQIFAAAAAVLIITIGIVTYTTRPAAPPSPAFAGVDLPSLPMLVTQSANAVQSPMQRQLEQVVVEVSSAAQALMPPWPTPSQSVDATATP